MLSARVREKLPQYVQVRDIMNRPVVSSQSGLDASGVGEHSGSVGPSSGRFHGVRSVSTPFPMEVSIYDLLSIDFHKPSAF